MNKYNCSLNDFIFSPKLWNEILNLNILDGKNINSELYEGEFKHEVRQFEKSYDNQQAEQISLMV